MKKWTFTKEDLILEEDTEKMALELKFQNPNDPSVLIVNSASRYLYSQIQIMHPLYPKIPLGFLEYDSAPPSHMFRTFNLLSSQDPITTIIWGSLENSTEELPLKSPNSRFLISFTGPSIEDFLVYEKSEGWAVAWTMTIFDVWLSAVMELLIGVSISDKQKPILAEKLLPLVFVLLKESFLACYAASNTPAQLLDTLITDMPPVMKKILTDSEVVETFVLVLAETTSKKTVVAAIKNIGPIAVVTKLVALLKFILAVIEPFYLKSNGHVYVDIPLRRCPCLKSPFKKLNVAAGWRTDWPLEVYMPDGRLFSFADEAFDAVVTRLGNGNDNQSYKLEYITVYSKFDSETLPFTLTIEAVDLGDQVHSLGVKPHNVNGTYEQGAYSFPKGLGKFIQGLAEGTSAVIATLDLLDNTYPSVVGEDRSSSIVAEVIVSPHLVKMKWKKTHISIITGRKVDLDIIVELPYNEVFQSNLPFTANIEFGPDYSWIQLKDIRMDGSLITYPICLTITCTGVTGSGEYVADFKPEDSLFTASQIGPVYFNSGLSQILRPLKEGSFSLTANLVIDDEEMEDVSPVADVTFYASVTLGRPILIYEETSILFEDELVKGVGVTVELPDGTVFSTSKNAMQAQAIMSESKLELKSIILNPDELQSIPSPINLIFEVNDTSIIFCSPNDFMGTNITNSNFYGNVDHFLKAKASGTTNITIKGVILDDSEVELNEPFPISIPVTVAQPAVVVLQGYEEILGNMLPIVSGEEIWQHNIIYLYGGIRNYTAGKTETYVYLNGERLDDANLPVNEDGTFTATVSGIQPGNNEIKVEAYKKVNDLSGGPDFEAFTLVGLPPELGYGSLEENTGKRTHSVEVKGAWCLGVSLCVEHPDGTKTVLPVVLDGAGNFNFTGFADMKLGENIISLTAVNGICSHEITGKITAVMPVVRISKIIEAHNQEYNISQNNSTVDAIYSPAIIAGLTRFVTKNVVISHYNPSKSKTESYNISSNSDFRQSVDIRDITTHNITLIASNDFGDETFNIKIKQLPFAYLWDLNVTANVTTVDTYLSVEVYDPSRGLYTLVNKRGYTIPLTWRTDEVDDPNSAFIRFFVHYYDGTPANNVKGDLVVYGNIFVLRGDSYVQKQNELVGEINPRYILDRIQIPQAPVEGWPLDGYERFISITLSYGFNDGDAAYCIGRRIK